MANETLQALRVRVQITGYVTFSDGRRQDVNIDYDRTITDGNGTNQAQSIWYDQSRTLAATSETIDLDGQTDAIGGSTSDWTNVKLACVINKNTATGEKLVLGGGDWAGTDALFVDSSSKANVGPDGIFLAVSPIDGFDITASTKDGFLQEAGSATIVSEQLLVAENT